MDGHNSHCSYTFCSFAEAHKIIILCLVAHTTHRCQPNDVGVFGPLASSWKSEVVKTSRKFQKITKYNLLGYYHAARTKAFKKSTIQAAFRKTGIHPFDRNIIEDDAFEPAKNTTTQAALPVAPRLPSLLQLIRTPSEDPDLPTQPNSPTTPSASSGIANASYSLIGFPVFLPSSASRSALLDSNRELVEYATKCKEQMEADYASGKLMQGENGRLREELFAKKNKPAKQRVGGAGARHMTSEETLEQLAFIDWQASMAILHAEFQLDDRVKAAKAIYDASWKEVMEGRKRAEKDAMDAQKAIEREDRRAEVEVEKARKKAELDAEKAVKKAALDVEKAVKKAALDAEKAEKKAEVEAERERKRAEVEAERQRKAVEKERKREEKAAAPKKQGTKRKRTQDTHQEINENTPPLTHSYTPDTPPAQKRPRPEPRPAHRGVNRGPEEPMHMQAMLAPFPHGFGEILMNYVPVIDPSLL